MDYRPIPKQADAVIVGGGVVGSAVAYYLARRGLKPLLLERNRLAGEASGAAAGMLAALAEMEEAGPLYELARRSRDLFPELAVQLRELTGIDIALMRRGMLKVAQTPEQVDKLRATVAFQRESGKKSAGWMVKRHANVNRRYLRMSSVRWILRGMGNYPLLSLSLAFAQAAVALGAEVYEHCEVLQLSRNSARVSAGLGSLAWRRTLAPSPVNMWSLPRACGAAACLSDPASGFPCIRSKENCSPSFHTVR